MAQHAAITKMDRQTAKFLHSEVDKALTEVAKRFGLVYSSGSGSFDDQEYRAKGVFALPLSLVKTKEVSTDMISFGMAKRGTQVAVKSPNPAHRRGTILSARRTKYVVDFGDGREFLVPFAACSSLTPEADALTSRSSLTQTPAPVNMADLSLAELRKLAMEGAR
jgi:hypothetical protein